MAVFKCKMCGGTLEINNETVAVCQYCGTKQTLPKLDDDRKANLYDRANHFRRNNEFDKAMGIYEQILNDDNTDAETYWSLVLCRYGIEYVEDPSSRKRIPTVNRAQFTSIFDDEDYKSALQYADGYQKDIYEQEATAINDIQKCILAISSQEEPFDIFICYKESDNSGRRTPDSVLATELYHELTREGYKVFFSRITLEDKLGTAYEPYIFAALNSAKVMVVLGTKPEFFNAVWVKNEWSRYLALIKNGARKMLIPAYKDMDPYDLPEEFSHLQAQDMSKLGFMQDLIRGIKKIVDANNTKQTVSTTIITNENSVGNITALLKRGFMALEDGAWNKADDFFEQCLNQDAELAEAYLGKLMAELCVKNQDDLSECAEPFDNCDNYRKTIRFADNRLKIKMEDFITRINERNESNRLAEQYASCVRAMDLAKSEDDYISVAKRLAELGDYKDSVNLSKKCFETAVTMRKDAILADAKTWMTNAITSREKAIRMLKSIPGWKNSDELCLDCEKKIEELKAKAEADRLERNRKAEIDRIEAEKRKKRSKKIAIIVTSIVVAVIIFIIILNTVIIPNSKYNDAVALMTAQKYEDAINAFSKLNGFKDSEDKIEECQLAIMDSKMQEALNLLNEGKYEEAYTILNSLGDYNNASDIIKDNKYVRAIELFENKEYDSAILLFSQISEWKDSKEQIVKCNDAKNEIVYQKALSFYNDKNYKDAKSLFESILSHKESKDYVTKCSNALSQQVYEKAENYLKNNDWYNAAVTFYSIKDYSDAKKRSLSIWQDNLPQSTICTKTSIGSTNNFAVTNSGKILATGELNKGYGYTDFSPIEGWSNIISISANNHVLGLKKDGTVVAVGSDNTNELAVSSWRDIVQISAGGQGSFGVKSDGTVVSTTFIASSSDWKKFDYGQNDISDWEDIVYISASDFHTVGLKADGTVVAVGKNDDGLQQCGVDSWKDIVFIAAHTTGTYGVKADGTVVKTTSGYDVSSWRNIKTISVGDYHVVGLKKDGTVVANGGSVADNGELNVSGWSNIVSVVAGEKCTMALNKSGRVYVIGLVGHVDGRGQANGWTNVKIP